MPKWYYIQVIIPQSVSELELTAKEIRRNVIKTIYEAGSGHPGGSLSSVDILVALFFAGVLSYNFREPKAEKRDRFILSCGHVCPAYYAVLSKAGYFDESFLSGTRDLSSPLQGHPSSIFAPFVECSTGSLGQGLSVGLGMAIGSSLKTNKHLGCKVVVLSSDGEQNEGSHWEAVMEAGFRRVGNICLIIDRNEMQLSGYSNKILNTEPLLEKYHSFGWEAYEIDGHNFGSLLSVFSRFNEEKDKPKVVIARTTRGKGVSFMEGDDRYHSATLTEDEYQRAMEELK